MAVKAQYLGKFNYGLRIGLRGEPSNLKRVRSVAYALGDPDSRLSVPYGRTTTLGSLVRRNEDESFRLLETNQSGRTEAGTAFWITNKTGAERLTLYGEALLWNGTRQPVGTSASQVDLTRLLTRPPAFDLQITPAYAEAKREWMGFGRPRPFGTFVSEDFVTLRSLELRLVADAKSKDTAIRDVLSQIKRIEYCVGHTKDLPAESAKFVIREASLDGDGSFKIELPDHPEARRFPPYRTRWTVCVAVQMRNGRVWTFVAKNPAAVPAKESSTAVEDDFQPHLAVRTFVGGDYVRVVTEKF